MSLYFEVHLVGEEFLPATGPVLLAPVHRSRWDPFMLYVLAHKRLLRFMASKDEFVGLQGWLMRRLGAFPVNTQRPSADMIRHCLELLSSQEVLVVFPEGNLYYYAPNEVHPLKPGVAWLALNCQRELPDLHLPVVPVRFVYADRVLGFRSRADIVVQKPLLVKEYLDLPPKEGLRRLTADLQQALGDVVNETPSLETFPQKR
ncbi:lysophospholipid acyltransferase family protein [Anthocerotibacter panamensis]|uniref:lysophospholipid acyltransferase family protein n=1 Tax=Anthocerotibacter panamensis TaxID=2857077 RepID=UPI001C40436C|nr:lysophospholipid acyltransferase family protein [Anthocerotibacter panamensis]